MRRFGDLEAVIMDRLWEQGRPMLVREMVEALRGGRPLAYTTVMTVMENLHRKGWLRREREGRAWRYEPRGSRSGYTAALMTDALATSSDRRTALAHFVLQMSPHDAALLREALDRAQTDPAPPIPGSCPPPWWRSPPLPIRPRRPRLARRPRTPCTASTACWARPSRSADRASTCCVPPRPSWPSHPSWWPWPRPSPRSRWAGFPAPNRPTRRRLPR